MRESFHERLKRLREAKGWGIAKLAKRSELSEPIIDKLETDPHYVPSWGQVSKLAAALKTNSYYLASGEGASKPFRVPYEYPAKKVDWPQTQNMPFGGAL